MAWTGFYIRMIVGMRKMGHSHSEKLHGLSHAKVTIVY